jgi:hypothetical protein
MTESHNANGGYDKNFLISQTENSYLFRYIVGWSVSSSLLIPIAREQTKEQDNYNS